ncbi:MAG TPA: GntR family transcriptional regulator [Candidatus Limnocylindrales bacterium]|nr:GntR family transcriptional regulator [Candidatus Limnocylindrales bacterium]
MARFQLEPGPIPLHHQVYLDLRAALDAGEWRTGERLPPERDLAGRYGCSLITVRRALADLAREERLERTRGRGTFVTAPRIVRELSSTLSFAQEMELRGLEPRTQLLTACLQPAAEGVAAPLLIPAGAPTFFLERLRSAADRPLLLEQAHLSAERFPDLLTADLEHGSLYDFLAARYDCRIERLRETIEPVMPPAREAGLLGQSRRTPALLLEGTAFDAADRPVEFSRTYVPGDRSKFLIESTGRSVRGLRSMRGSEQGAAAIDGLVLTGGSGTGNERGRDAVALEEGSRT